LDSFSGSDLKAIAYKLCGCLQLTLAGLIQKATAEYGLGSKLWLTMAEVFGKCG